jgi:VWFA-related protein
MGARQADAGRDLVLVFSDGRDTASWLQAETVLETARRSEVVVYGISVRGSRSTRFLGALGAATGGEAFEVDTTSDLRARFLTILNGFRERYLVSYSPHGVQRGGWHKLDVKIRGRAGTVRARPGYFDRDEQ